jgi:hypothetical protein
MDFSKAFSLRKTEPMIYLYPVADSNPPPWRILGDAFDMAGMELKGKRIFLFGFAVTH